MGSAKPPPCGDPSGTLMVLDVTGDGGVDISDAIRLLGYLFVQGEPPASRRRRPRRRCEDRCED